MGNVTFGREEIDRVSSSASIPWDHIKNFKIVEEPFYLVLDHNDEIIQKISIEDWPSKSEEFKLLENLSDQTTYIFISINDAYYTLFHDLIPFIHKLHLYDPSIHFLLLNPSHGYGSDSTGTKKSRNITIDYLKRFLTYLGISYTYHGPMEEPVVVKVNKLFQVESNSDLFFFSLGDVDYSMSAIKNHVLSEEDRKVTPHRKVYLTRTHLKPDRSQPWQPLYGGTNRFFTDVRIENEEILEEYFRNKGYEILIPEHKFSTFEEQVKYFNETKILAGVTGTGLSNVFFMQENQFLVEIGAELVFEDDHFGYGCLPIINSEHYLFDAYINKQIHISIPSRRDAYEVIDRIEKISDRLDLN